MVGYKFISAVCFSSQGLSLEEQAVVSLWYHRLSSLEEAVLSLLESVMTNKGSTSQRLEQQITQSLLVGDSYNDSHERNQS